MKRRSDYIEIPKATLERLYYDEGLTQREIAQRFGVNPKTIGNRMAEYGMITRTSQDYVYVDIPKIELERLYLVENRSASEIASIYGCAVSVVYKRLKEHEIPIKPAGWDKLKRIVPDDQLAWSPAFAYVVGLVAADGTLEAGSNEVRMVSTDREIVELYCWGLGLRPDDIPAENWNNQNAVEAHVRIERRPPYKDQYHVVFSDYIYRARLEEIGLMPNKSSTLSSLQIPDKYFRDFLRGEFDGDGCWSADRRVGRDCLLGITTSGSRPYLEWLKESIRRLAGIKTGYISGIDLRYEREQAEQLGRFIYYAPELPCLRRKRAKWERWMMRKQR